MGASPAIVNYIQVFPAVSRARWLVLVHICLSSVERIALVDSHTSPGNHTASRQFWRAIEMDSTPSLRPPPLKLRTSPNDLDNSACTQCLEVHPPGSFCAQRQRVPLSPSAVPSSDFSSYTACISPSTSSLCKSPSSISPADSDSSSSSSLSSPAPSIKVRASRNTLPRAPTLRRKISPTQTSLRDIRATQQRMQVKHSEDQLRRLYERQTMEYLHGDFACLDGLRE